MNIVGEFASGLVSVLKIVGAPLLYRYPYRNSAEGLHTDWLAIGKDIESVMGKMKSEAQDERRHQD